MPSCVLSPSKLSVLFGNSIPMSSKRFRHGIVMPSGRLCRAPADIQRVYRNVSFAGNNRLVFNIMGNQHRLVMAVQYQYGIIYVRFVGSHQDYDKIDVSTI